MSFPWFAHASTYQYSALDPQSRTFRLVRLLPSVRSLFGQTPRLEIIKVDLDAACSYNTLSYAWSVSASNSPNQRVIVEVGRDQFELQVSKSLHDALLHIKTNQPLFVDQICIHQHDDNEKASQVKLMRDIYTNCDRVLIWLGLGTRQSDAYFDFTQEVCSEGTLSRLMGPNKGHFKQVFDAVMDSNIDVSGAVREDRDDLLNVISTYGKMFPLDGSRDVLGRTWFTRLWTIQEICLAPEVTFICGSKSLCYDCFRGGSLFYSVYNTHYIGRVRFISRRELKKRDDIFRLTQSLLRMVGERRAIHLFGQRLTLYSLVLKYSVNNHGPKIGASKDDDRLFAIMGLAEIQSLSGIIVRYGETAKVYTEFAAMLAIENLDILLYSQFPKRIDLPSWVPDWSTNLTVPHGYRSLTEPVYTAGGTIQDPPQIDTDEGCLFVKGLFIDQIVRVGEHQIERKRNPLDLEDAHFPSVKRVCDALYSFLPQAYQVTGDPKLAIARVLDFGLTFKEFQSEGEQTADERMTTLFHKVLKLAQLEIDSSEGLQAYTFFRAAETVIKKMKDVPWQWIPFSEIDELYL